MTVLIVTTENQLTKIKSYWNNIFKIKVPENNYCGTAAALDRLVNSNPKLAKKDSYEMIYSQKLLFACVQSILSNGEPVDLISLKMIFSLVASLAPYTHNFCMKFLINKNYFSIKKLNFLISVKLIFRKKEFYNLNE